ncbi:DUF2785 domain-containing protein [Levilactobacillus angrenensis]|uniref:DUF2785 domain-containing protein n=1 Tax=Levilactobacillus angrenensis TaxID=2486020 RepID=A0ABW1UB05_9LACO|nr:DUF2785 domain-containing protein [Levilactobacillus angrenensis]
MDAQLKKVLSDVAVLSEQVRQGEVYQSLGRRLGQIMDGIKRHRRTTVTLPDDQDGVQDVLADFRHQLDQQVPVTLTQENIKLLLAHLASTDAKLRYQGINFTFYDAFQQDALDSQQIRFILDQLSQPEALFAHILEPANNAVFGRAGHVAMLGVVLHFLDQMIEHVDKDKLHQIVILAATYLCLETDTRGFVNQSGWAHAFTAIADLLAVLSNSLRLPRADKLFLMTALMERMKRLNTPLIYGENDRIANYLTEITNRSGLYADFLVLILKNWRQQVALKRRPDNIAGWNRFFNRKRLLDALRLRQDLPAALKGYLSSTIDFLG